MNIKKLFAILAGVSMVANVALPGLAQAATPDNEYGRAYTWAYSQGVTTKDTYEAANMGNEITRAEFAKMASQWAMKLLGKKVNEDAVCNFSDINSVQGDLRDFVITSCQLGIMGQLTNGNTEFRPHALITRGEIGTVLSRALWNSTYEGATPYFADHLKALQKAGIMKKIDNPYDNAKRGDVMLMLHRTSEGEAINEANELLACLAKCEADDTECVMACSEKEDENNDKEKEVVKSGSLEITATAADGKKVVSDGATSYLDTITFKTSEDITLNSITLERYGYSTTADVDKIWLEDTEGNVISSEKSLSSSKDSVTLSIKKDYRTISNKDSVIIAVKTATAAALAPDTHGTNIGFKVTEVDSSAKDLDKGDYSANLYDIIDYAGSEVVVDLKGKTGKTYNVAAGEEYEVAKLKVSATNSAITVNGFTLTNGGVGKLDLSDNIDDVTVKVDGKDVEGLKYNIKKDELKVNFEDVKIEINKNSLFTVYVTLKDDFEDYGDQVTFYLDKESDLKALEEKNGTTVKFKATSQYKLANAYTYTFAGGKVTLTNTKLASSIDAAAGSEDVVIAQGTIKLGGEPINIEALTITPTVTTKNGAHVVSDIVENIKVYVDDEPFEIDSTTTWTIKDILIEEDATIKVAVDLEDDNINAFAGETLTFKIGTVQSINATSLNAAGGNVEYDNSGTPVSATNIAGSITISTIKVNESTASLKLKSGMKDAEFVKGQTTTKTIFEGTYTAKKGDVDLNEVALIYKGSRKLAATDVASFNVYIVDEKNPVVTVDKDDVIFSGALASNPENLDESDYVDFSDISVKDGKEVYVKVVAEIYTDSTVATGTEMDAQKFVLVLRGDDKNGIAAGRAKADTVKLSIKESESVKVTDGSAKKTVVKQDSDIVLAQFTVKPSNTSDDEVDLTNLVLTFTNFSGLDVDNLEVTVDEDPITLDASDLSAGVLTLDDISKPVSSEGVVVEVRYTDELVASSAANKPYTVTVTQVNTSTPGTVFTRYVVPALIKISSTKIGDGDATKFTIDLDAEDDATITGFVLTHEGGTATLDDVSDGSFVEVNGSSAQAYFVTGVSYYVNGKQYSISKTDYVDYFKDGESYLKVYQSK